MTSASTSNTASSGSNATSESFTYNDRGEVLTASGTAGSTSYGYNGDGQVASVADAAGTTGYTYDSAGRLATLADPASGTTATYTYNPDSQVSQVSYGTGNDTQSFGYDGQHRLTSDTLKTSSGTTVASVGYGYNADGEITSQTTASLAGPSSNTYTYDEAGRLTSWNNGTTTTAYGYDGNGNLTQDGAKTYTYDARDELTSDGVNSYTYTARGTPSSESSLSGTIAVSFDAYGDQATAGTRSYTYDALGRLTADTPTAGGGGYQFSYAGSTGTIASDGVSTYTWDPSGSMLAGVGAAGGGSGVLALTNAHGDVLGQFAASGTAVSGSQSYDPWGKVTATTGTSQGLLGYQSAWSDPASGKDLMGARWYAPGSGDFTSADTVQVSPDPDPAAGNPFAYAGDEPLDVADPSGHCGIFGVGCGVEADVKSAVKTTVKKAVSTVKAVVKKAVTAVKVVAKKTVAAVAHTVRDVTTKVVDAVKTVAKTVAAVAKTVVKKVTTAVKTVVKKAAAVVKTVAKKAVSVVKTVASKAAAVAKTVASKTVSAAKTVARTAVSAGRAVASGAADAADAAAGEVKAHWRGMLQAGEAVAAVALTVANVMQLGLDPATDALEVADIGALANAGADEVASAAAETGSDEAASAAAETGGDEAPAEEEPATGEDDGGDSGNCPGGQSFTAGTLVLLASGQAVPISQLKAGDKVLAADTKTGKDQPETVTAVLVHHDTDLYNLTVKTGTGTGTEVIHTTSNHLFWDPATHQWVKAAALHKGEHLKTPNGILATADGGTTPKDHEGWMWDLTVPGNNDHDFYVAAGATTVLVHNSDDEQCSLFDDSPYRAPSATPASTEPVRSTLNIGDDSYSGTSLARGNPPIKGTFSFFVEHAEGDAFSQAVTSGTDYSGASGTLSVTQAPCGFCVSSISAVARSMGLSYLRVETPEGLFGEYTPETGLTRTP